MTRPTKTSAALLFVALTSITLIIVLRRPGVQYLLAGVMGRPRPDLATVWSLLVPLVTGLGATLAIGGLALLRTVKEGRLEDVRPIATASAAAVLSLVLVHAVASGPQSDRPRNPQSSYEAFTSGQWRTLANTDSPDLGNLGPLRESGPGLRDNPGYLPYDPCLLVRRTFLTMSEEEVIAVLGPPLVILSKDGTYPHQYLQYRMLDAQPRHRIANLIIRTDPGEDGRWTVVFEKLYPMRISADCPQSRYASSKGRTP